METIARAVQYAHEKGVLHRDLKPANILRGKDRALKLTDFGLAKHMEVSSGMTPSNAVMGTPSYMSPEQAEGKTKLLGPTTDVYGLGAILYELLTGRPPFRGVNMVDTLEQVRWAEPAPPTRLAPRLPRDLSTICLKCLQKSPARRYQTAGELADDLRRWMNGETIAARPAPTWERLWRQVRRRPWEAVAIATSVLLVVLLAGGLVANTQQQRERAAEAARQADKETAARELRNAQAAAAAALQRKQEENARLLRERGMRSLATIEEIRQQVLYGNLKGTPGLHDLYGVLASYYKQHIDEALEDPSPDRAALAELAHQIGDLASRSGNFETAERLFEQARGLYAKLAETDPQYRAQLGEVSVKVARVLYDRNQDARALAECDAAERLWKGALEAATKANSGRLVPSLQLGEVAHLRGELRRRQYDTKGALAAFTEAIKFREDGAQSFLNMSAAELRAQAARPRMIQALRDLGRGYGYRGDEYLRLGDATAADRDYWSSHRFREKVAAALADPNNSEGWAELDTAKF